MEVIKRYDNQILTIELIGNLNSVTAPNVEQELINDPRDDTNEIIINVQKLDYISSAGLRIILGLKKRAKQRKFKIINANNDVMKVFEDTGFADMMDISRALRQISVDGLDIIGAGACGECYRIDDETIIKLYYGKTDLAYIEKEKELAKKAFILGIPTAISYDIVECGDRKGVVYELVKSKTITELIREDLANIDKYIKIYTDTCIKVHKTSGASYDLPSFKDEERQKIEAIIGLKPEEKILLNKFLDMIPDDDKCIHGDLNPNNIMVEHGEGCLIDMGEFSIGSPLFDLSRIIFSFDYARPDGDYNSFYKLPNSVVLYIRNKFLDNYFGTHDDAEIIKKYEYAKFIHPLAWFRVATTILIKPDKWPSDKVEMAKDLVHNRLMKFIKDNL